MQIDFHHGTTYVIARLAGFSQDEAQIIAHSAQYVDDAIHDGAIFFENKSIYRFRSSAHRMLDYRNFRKLANHRVWIPFHFLPGNQVEKLAEGQKISNFVQRIICRPNSEIAQKMVDSCLEDYASHHSLYRLGVTMHVYADTWAHQGFAGITHQVNMVQDIRDHEGVSHDGMNTAVRNYFKKNIFEQIRDWILSKLISDVNPIGHGAVLSYPDRPYLTWQYVDWKGDVISRNNPQDYMDAVDHIFMAMCRFRGESSVSMNVNDRKIIEELIRTICDENGEVRHQKWLNAIADGRFSFGAENIHYFGTGANSWVAMAMPTLTDECDLSKKTKCQPLPFKKEFLHSHWKCFHDAIRIHRSKVLHEILPEFEIMAE